MEEKRTDTTEQRGNPSGRNKGQRHRRTRRNYTLFYILLAVFIAGAGVYLSLTMFFNLEEIIVEGNSRYTEEELIEITGVKPGDNLFKIDTAKAEHKLLTECGYIDAVEVKRQFPTRLYITVEEAKPFAALEESDGYTLVSARGKALERALETPPKDLMLVRGISTVLSSEEDEHRLNILYEILTAMDEMGMDDYNFIDLTDTLDIVMICRNRLRVEMGNELELKYKLQFVDEVVNNKLGSEGFMMVDASQPGEIMTKTMTVSPWDTIITQSPQVVTDDEEE